MKNIEKDHDKEKQRITQSNKRDQSHATKTRAIKELNFWERLLQREMHTYVGGARSNGEGNGPLYPHTSKLMNHLSQL